MTNLVNGIEAVTPSGTTLTAGAGGNTGDAADNFLDTISIGTSCTLASDSTHAAHGALSCKVATAATSAIVYAQWDASLGSSVSQAWFRQYLYFTANPAAAYDIFEAHTSGGVTCASVQLNTAGTLTFRDKNGASITGMTTTETIPLNQWCRIEGFVIGSATVGQVELKIFFGANPDAATPTNTYTSAATQNTNAAMGQWRFGLLTSRANAGPFWQDDLGVSNTGYLGPVVTAVPQPGQPQALNLLQQGLPVSPQSPQVPPAPPPGPAPSQGASLLLLGLPQQQAPAQQTASPPPIAQPLQAPTLLLLGRPQQQAPAQQTASPPPIAQPLQSVLFLQRGMATPGHYSQAAPVIPPVVAQPGQPQAVTLVWLGLPQSAQSPQVAPPPPPGVQQQNATALLVRGLLQQPQYNAIPAPPPPIAQPQQASSLLRRGLATPWLQAPTVIPPPGPGRAAFLVFFP